jgi:hypothetical protein
MPYLHVERKWDLPSIAMIQVANEQCYLLSEKFKER